MPDVAISTAAPSDLRVILGTNPNWTVVFGPAPASVKPPFVSCWLLDPERTAAGLTQRQAGQVHDRWRINCFGVDMAQAKAVRDALLQLAWTDGWELVDIGAAIPDTAPAPVGWFIPVDYKFTTVA